MERYDVDDVVASGNDIVAPDFNYPFLCRGIRRLDLVVHANIISIDGVDDTDFVVSSFNSQKSLLVPAHLLEKDPSSYLTPEIAKKIVTLSREEAEELHLADSVFRLIDLRYPGIKSLTR